MTRNKIIEILKSGEFTIVYHDNGFCVLHKKKYEDYDKVKGNGIELDGWTNGYIPVEVEYLVEALGGKVITI